MKKTIIATSICISMVGLASSYFSIIQKDENYEISKNQTKIITGEWYDVGIPTCSNDVEVDDVYFGKDFTQTSTCDQIQEREIVTKVIYLDGSESIIDTKKETQTKTEHTTLASTGTFILSSCKEILDQGYSTGSESYRINPNATEMDINCDMTTDNGGWTEIAHVVSGSQQVYSVAIDDKNISYDEVLYLDIDSKGDYYLPYENNTWEWIGFDISKNVLKIGGKWRHVKSLFSAANGCDVIPDVDSFALSDYRILENSSVCIDSITPNNNCGTKVVINIPDGMRLDGYGDVESVSNVCYGDNNINANFKLLVR